MPKRSKFNPRNPRTWKNADAISMRFLLHVDRVLSKRAQTARQLLMFARNQAFRPGDELVAPAQVAERLQVPKSWVYESTRTRRAGIRNNKPLPYIRIGRYLHFNWSDVVKWLNEQSNSVEVG